MGKRKRKILVDNWRLGEHESWFSDMAQEGWHLQKVGVFFACFEQGECKAMRYRIDTTSNKKMSTGDKEMFQEAGWTHVTKFGDFNIFSSLTELQAPELHTDSAEQAYTLQEWAKKIRKNTVMIVILCTLTIATLASPWYFDRTPYLTIVKGDFLPVVVMLTLISSAYTMLQANFSIRKLRKTLLEGSIIDHHAAWRKKRWTTLAIQGFLSVLVIINIALLVAQIMLEKAQTLPVDSANLPIVRLVDIEQNPNMIREEYYEEEQLDRLNQYTYNWSLVAPLQYESYEHSIVPDQLWQDVNETYSPSLNTQVYKLNLPSMKEKLLVDLTRINHYWGAISEVESDVFELLFIREEDGFKEVVAAKGRGVMHVNYYGYADMDSILKAVEEKLALIEK